MINYVIIKPDAFTTKISSEIARQLFFDFAYFLIYDEVNTTLQLLKKSNAQGTFRSIISLQINPYERE